MGPTGSPMWIHQDPPCGSTRFHHMDPLDQDPPHGSTRIHHMDPQHGTTRIHHVPRGPTRIHHIDQPGSITRIHQDPPFQERRIKRDQVIAILILFCYIFFLHEQVLEEHALLKICIKNKFGSNKILVETKFWVEKKFRS